MWLADLERLRGVYDRWNARIERSRDDYEAHPSTICLGTRRVDGEEVPCFNARTAGDALCGHCTERRWAAARMAARRSS